MDVHELVKSYSLRSSDFYSFSTEDTGSYNPLWQPWINQSGWTYSDDLLSAFKYQTQQELNGSWYWGYWTMYSGGGYIANLGNHKQGALSLVDELEGAGWVDHDTRAIIFEFNMWNANTNLFNLFVLSLEFPPPGGLCLWNMIEAVNLYRYSGPGGVMNLSTEIFVTVYILILTVFTLMDIVKERLRFWTNPWNVLLVVSLCLFYAALGCYVMRSLWTMACVELMMNNPGKTNLYME